MALCGMLALTAFKTVKFEAADQPTRLSVFDEDGRERIVLDAANGMPELSFFDTEGARILTMGYDEDSQGYYGIVVRDHNGNRRSFLLQAEGDSEMSFLGMKSASNERSFYVMSTDEGTELAVCNSAGEVAAGMSALSNGTALVGVAAPTPKGKQLAYAAYLSATDGERPSFRTNNSAGELEMLLGETQSGDLGLVLMRDEKPEVALRRMSDEEYGSGVVFFDATSGEVRGGLGFNERDGVQVRVMDSDGDIERVFP